MQKIRKFLKENYKNIIFLILMVLIVKVELPYYIEAPGGTINLSEKIDKNYNKSDGSLNMLYVTEYRGNLVTVLLSKLISSWDLFEISNQQVSNEDSHDIYLRNKYMLDNSKGNAIYVAYQAAGKKIKIIDKQNIIIANLKDNDLKIGDEVLKIDNLSVDDITTIKNHLDDLSPGDKVNLLVKRNNQEKTITMTLDQDKMLGIMMITNYNYDLPDDLNLEFARDQGGSSGGLILSLGIYSKITGIDILKGRNVAGTGTIDINGNVGEIDGIKYKIAGAVKKHMDVVLVSPYNYDEAKQVIDENNYNIELVKVSTFKEALEYLTK